MAPNKSFHLAADHPAKSSETFAAVYFIWIGGAFGCSWNAVVNSFDYFNKQYPKDDVTFVWPIPIIIAQLIITFVITHLSKIVSFNVRILSTLSLSLIGGIFMPIQAKIFGSEEAWSTGAFISLGLVLFIGICSNLCFASLLGFASQIHGKFSGYALIGIGVFGLSLNFIKQSMIWILDGSDYDEFTRVMLFFIVAYLLIIVGIVLHLVFLRTAFYKFVIEDAAAPETTDNESLLSGSESVQPTERNFKTLMIIYKKARLYVILSFIINMQTTIAFPGLALMKKIPSMDEATKNVSIITSFNVFFLLGKVLGQQRKWYDKKAVIVTVIVRFFLIAFFVIIAATDSIPIFNTVWFCYINVAVFGLTIGFGNVALFFMIPEQVEKALKEVAGFMTVIQCNIGNLLGGFLALPFKNIG